MSFLPRVFFHRYNLMYSKTRVREHNAKRKKRSKYLLRWDVVWYGVIIFTWYFFMLSSCSCVASTIWAIWWVCSAGLRSGTCGAGARFTIRPSFSIRKWSRGGGTGRIDPFNCKQQQQQKQNWIQTIFRFLWGSEWKWIEYLSYTRYVHSEFQRRFSSSKFISKDHYFCTK